MNSPPSRRVSGAVITSIALLMAAALGGAIAWLIAQM
jgi:hypothetical protein